MQTRLIRFRSKYLLVILFLYIFLGASCSQNKNAVSVEIADAIVSEPNKQEVFSEWSQEEYLSLFDRKCIEKDYRKELVEQYINDYPIDSLSLQITQSVDTSQLMGFKSALIIGFCVLGEGSGWGNDLYFIGYDDNQEKVKIKSQLLDESLGLTINPEKVVQSAESILIEVEGYSSENEPACCRDTNDQILITVKDAMPIMEYLTLNTYQVRELALGDNNEVVLSTEVFIPSVGTIEMLAEEAFRKYVGRSYTEQELERFINQVEAFAYNNPKTTRLIAGKQVTVESYSEEALREFTDSVLLTWSDLREEIGNYYGVKEFTKAFKRVFGDGGDISSQTTLEELLR